MQRGYNAAFASVNAPDGSFHMKCWFIMLSWIMRPLCLNILLCLTTAVQAELVLDQNPLVINPKPEDEVVESTFTFTNKSDKPLRITGLDSSCSCLEASLDKAVYQPGEKGTGRAKFKVSSFTGKQEKALHIYTDDPAEPDKVLMAIIDVPVMVVVEPQLLEWVVGDKPEPKDFIIKITGKDPMNVTEVKSTRESVSVGFKEITPGREYHVTVKPSSTADVVIGAVTIMTDSKIPKYQRQLAFFNVVRPEQSERIRKARENTEK